MLRSILRLASCAGPLLLSLCLPASVQAQAASAPTYVMVIHGGAGTILPSRMTPGMGKAYIDTFTIALRTGYESLQRRGSRLDAVGAAVARIRGSEGEGRQWEDNCASR